MDRFRIRYGTPTGEQENLSTQMKEKAQELSDLISRAGDNSTIFPHADRRALATAQTRLEEAVMWGVKGVMTTEGQAG